jgi:3-oxoacyl-[acyl-carrier protein] reductase
MPTVTTDHPRVVVMTGGSGGIGGGTAQRLARDGMAIVVAYVGRKAPAEEVVFYRRIGHDDLFEPTTAA